MYTILVCDDEQDIVSALEIYLTAEGYRVLKAYNGKEALDRKSTRLNSSHPLSSRMPSSA